MPDPAPPRKARICGGRPWLVPVAVPVGIRIAVRIAGAGVQGGLGSAARVLVLAENPRAVRRTVNPNWDRDEQAMLEVLEVLEMLERHGSQTGTVLASSPGPTMSRSGALPVKGLELVVGRRRLCGDLSPESALAILQKTPPDAVWIHD